MDLVVRVQVPLSLLKAENVKIARFPLFLVFHCLPCVSWWKSHCSIFWYINSQIVNLYYHKLSTSHFRSGIFRLAYCQNLQEKNGKDKVMINEEMQLLGHIEEAYSAAKVPVSMKNDWETIYGPGVTRKQSS